ncbi:MAG: cytochrome c-type biosis protein CcmH [Pseudomonadota bacterium]
MSKGFSRNPPSSPPVALGSRFVLAISVLMLMWGSPLLAQGSGPTPPLANQQLPDPALESSATQLMHGLRCIQCQGQSIADSDAAMAETMRSEVRQQILAGKNPESIRQWMIERYGQWVSFEPEWSGAGLILWIAPLLMLVAALWLARGLFRTQR